ncbi:MAG: bifunctional adenosylcobinamide kinase/adenosylcobinamide-phosphate guanylyltransferase [Sphingobium sp.]
MTSLFVLGGARSGKSRYAQMRAEQTGLDRIFIATAQAYDGEMEDRIAHHRDERGDGWHTVEVPLDLTAAIRDQEDGAVLLIDCLTLWTSNLLLAGHDALDAVPDLIEAIGEAAGPIILVSNEVGLGIVPDNALARRFRDMAGIVNQRVAAAVGEVQFLVSGLPLRVK